MTSDKCRTKLFNLIESGEAHYLDIAMLLYKAHFSNRNGCKKISKTNWLQDWGYENLHDFSERELKKSYRAVKYWLDTAEAVYKFNLDVSRLKRIPRSKLGRMVQVMNESNIEDCLRIAETKTTEEIKAYVNMMLGRKYARKLPPLESLIRDIEERYGVELIVNNG
jgi:hypothetical protein